MKIIKSDKSSVGTSFHGTTIDSSLNELIELFGEPQYKSYDTDEDMQYEWTLEDQDGNIITVYDWKEDRDISETEIITFNVGGANMYITETASEFLTKFM